VYREGGFEPGSNLPWKLIVVKFIYIHRLWTLLQNLLWPIPLEFFFVYVSDNMTCRTRSMADLTARRVAGHDKKLKLIENVRVTWASKTEIPIGSFPLNRPIAKRSHKATIPKVQTIAAKGRIDIICVVHYATFTPLIYNTWQPSKVQNPTTRSDTVITITIVVIIIIWYKRVSNSGVKLLSISRVINPGRSAYILLL